MYVGVGLLRVHYTPLQRYMGYLCTRKAQYAPPRRNMHHMKNWWCQRCGFTFCLPPVICMKWRSMGQEYWQGGKDMGGPSKLRRFHYESWWRISALGSICPFSWNCIYRATVVKQNYFTGKVTYFTTIIGCGQISMNIWYFVYWNVQPQTESLWSRIP